MCSLIASLAHADYNWPFGPPAGASGPGGGPCNRCPGPNPNKPPRGGPDKDCGSIIGCESQTVGEAIDVTGTKLRLHYQSERVPGSRSMNTLKIRLSGATLPPGLQRIHLEIAIAGQEVARSFAPQPDLVDTFNWDGKDAYGRTLQGQQLVKLRIGYEYTAQYYATSDAVTASYNRFGLPPNTVPFGGGGAVVFSRIDIRLTSPPIILWQDYEASLGSLGSVVVGGWTLNVHHAYEAVNGTLHLGDGDQRSIGAQGVKYGVISTAAGTGDFGFAGDAGPATLAQLNLPQAVAAGADGSVYIVDRNNNRIRRVGPDGVITTVAGGGTFGSPADDVPATAAFLNDPQAVAVAHDGVLYITENGQSTNRVRRVGLDGIIKTVAGIAGFGGFSGDGGPAIQAELFIPRGLSVGPDGSLYIADAENHRIRRVGTDGIITTVAGSDSFGFSGDGGLATQAGLFSPLGVAVGTDGSVYIADLTNHRIRRVGPDGVISTVAGGGLLPTDGVPAIEAQLNNPRAIAVGIDGSLYIVSNNLIRLVGPTGIITTLAGTALSGFSGDGGPATQAQMNIPSGVAVGADGSVYIADSNNSRIRQLRPILPGFSITDLLIAAEDGSELYVFSGSGRHLRTLDTLTGALRWQFGYDGAGRLTTIADGDGNVTTVERNGSGNPTAIVAPFGQRTTLTINGNGYLASVANPAGQAVQLTYNGGSAQGLLATLTDPRGNVHRYFYDTNGRLVRDENPAGGVKVLARTDITDNHYAVTVTTALGFVTTHEVEELPTGETRRVRIEPSGARTEMLVRVDGSRQVTYPDGTVTNMIDGPDPRFGMQAPILKTLTITKPGGLAASRSATRTVTLSDPNNLLSLTAQTDTITTNGQTYTRTYTAATHKLTTTTPAGRQSVATLDVRGRVVAEQDDATFGLAPSLYTYDSKGRLTQLGQGLQSWTYSYDAQARLTARTDAAGGSIAFAYDAADRASQVTLPGGRTYGLGRDADGNRTSVAMPSLAAHLFDYNAVNQEGGYSPPGNSAYVTSYDADGRVNHVTLPSGRTQAFTYDGSNRSAGISYPEATLAFSYAAGDPTTRISSYTRTPVTGSAQQLQFTFGGDLVTGANWTGAAQGQYTYTYDGNFLLSSMALTSGADNVATALTRDGDRLVTALGPFTFARAGPGGAPSQISDGTLSVAQGYDTLARVANRTNTVAGQQKYAVELSRDNVGRISSKVETIAGITHTFAYTYDAVGHLSEVQRDSVITERYTYDANRNRSSRRFGNGPIESATYDSQDRLIQQGTSAYVFNADGYLTQRSSDTFQYSTTGELLVAVVGGQTVTYAYDGLRRRVSRTDAAGTIQYLYGNPDNDLQVSNTRSPSGVLTTYYYDEGRRLFALQRAAARYYVATDQLGSPRVITDAAGAVVKTLEYDAFGNVTIDSNPAFDLPIRFAGGLADTSTGLVRFGLRDYDPVAGRWTARDPAVFESRQANLYAYVNNNPINLIDPVGFASAGLGLCEGVCVGLKLGWTKDGVSACFEAGVGKGNSLDLDPFGALDDNGLSTELKGSIKVGIAKIELGADVPVGPCAGFSKAKPKAEACVGPFCANTNKEGKGSFDVDESGKGIKSPWKTSGGLGLEGKYVGKLCQQAKW